MEENLRRRRKEKKKQKNWNERTRTQTKLSSRWKIFGSIVAQTVKFLCNRTFDSYACSGYVCGMDSRRSTGSISLYRRGVYIGLFAMPVDVSCARGVKWAAWHLQLQPLGLNKGRSLAAFPTQLSPFYRGFHSCFISSVSLHRVHTMRRHLGRVHSSVFSIFFPSCFWLLLFSSLFLFSSSSFALLPQTSPSPTGTRRIRRLQPIRKLYPLLRRISMITEVSLELDRTRRLVAFVSARIILHDRFFLTGLSVFGLGRDSDRSVWSTNGWIRFWIRELENLSLLRFYTFSKSLNDTLNS